MAEATPPARRMSAVPSLGICCARGLVPVRQIIPGTGRSPVTAPGTAISGLGGNQARRPRAAAIRKA